MNRPDDETRRIELAQLRRLEFMSLVEATTLLALVCVAVPMKHVFGAAALVQVIGPIHGLVFLAYVWTAIQTASGGSWSRTETARLFVGAVVPLGGLFNLPLLARKTASLKWA